MSTDFTPGRPQAIGPGIIRIVAPNPGPLTGPGTNTYLVGTDELAVIDPGHAFDADKFSRILSVLKDCSKVYISQIGEVPAAKLKESGVEPVVYSGPIAAITV